MAALSLGAAFVSTAAQAQSIPAGDLVLGFTSQSAGVTNDYVVDLGTVPGTQNTVLPTTGYSSSTFNSTFANSALDNGGVNVGIVGGVDTGTPSIYFSVADDGTGTASVPGSTPPLNPSRSDIGLAAGTVGGLQTGTVPYAAGFTGQIAENPSTPGTQPTSFSEATGDNPLTTIPAGTSDVLLDIYQDSGSGAHGTTGYQYVGDVLLNITDSGMTATYDPIATPEPSTYALLAGGGLVAFAFRRKLVRQNA